jgi:dipeptidase E
MKKLLLTSSVFNVGSAIVRRFGKMGSRLTCINTASEVEKGDLWWLRKDRESLVKAGFEVVDYTVTGKTKGDVEKELGKTDVIFFSGGNVFYLLQQIQHVGCADSIRKFVANGKPYIGSSAGSVIAGPDVWPVCQ